MNGIEVSVRVAGDSFRLHVTGSDGGWSEHHGRRGNTWQYNGRPCGGFAATNESKEDGAYHYIFIPEDVARDMMWNAPGSSRVFKFSDVIIGPKYFDYFKGWHMMDRVSWEQTVIKNKELRSRLW